VQPNVLIILADQLRRQALSCYGDPNIRTRHIDALAAGGVRFDAACSTYPVCVPFRFSFMTGQYAHTRLVPSIHWRMSPAERTLADEFNDAGYHTAYVGKWHLEGCRPDQPIPRSRQGRWTKWLGFELRNSHFDTWYYEDEDPTPKPLNAYQTDGLFDLAIDHLRNGRPDDRPFCCVLSVEPPHFPYEAPEDYQARWAPRAESLELPGTFETTPNYPVPLSHWDGDDTHTAEIKRQRVATYYAMIENLDDNIGKMLNFLRETDLDDDTIVMLLSDHGEMGGMHALPTAMKAYPFEESVGIPWIVRDPSCPARSGHRIPTPTCTEDLYPTLCGLAGLTPITRCPGEDLTGLIRGQDDPPSRQGVLLESVHDFRPPGAFYQRAYRALRTERWMYAVLQERGPARPWLLFDLHHDPLQQRNLLGEPGVQTTAARLHVDLARMLVETDDHFALTDPPA
jgi:arylsulfatase A-like enzyme